MIFCDTSTLAKYYVPEAETPAVQERLDSEDTVWVSELARTELMAVFHRRLREGKWSEAIFRSVVRQFDRDELSGIWNWIPLTAETTGEAAQVFRTLPENIFLRAADCLHLVSAIQNGFSMIYTHDRHQISGARALGLETVMIVP